MLPSIRPSPSSARGLHQTDEDDDGDHHRWQIFIVGSVAGGTLFGVGTVPFRKRRKKANTLALMASLYPS